MKNKKFDKNKLLAASVTVLLVIFFIGGFLIGLDRVRSMEGTYPEPVNDLEATLAPSTKEEAVEFLYELIEKAQEEKPQIGFSLGFSIDDSKLEASGSDEFRQSLILAKGNILDHISSTSVKEGAKTSAAFGEGIADVLRYPDITIDDVESISDDMAVFTCLSCGETIQKNEENTTAPSSCEKCGSARAYFEKYKDEFTVDIIVTCEAPFAEDSVLNRNFSPRTTQEISALTADKLTGVAKLDIDAENDIVYNTLKISYTFNRIRNEITSLRFVKEMTVSAEITFENEYAVLGTQSVTFPLTETVSYNFTWAGLHLSEAELVIEPGNSDNLLATVVCDDPVTYSANVKWSSSDESVATVDERGYIYATDKTGEVIITAEVEYQGKVYSDECTVYVRVPVESMKMKTKKAELNVGETAELEVQISPKKATEQSVRWHSENEEIATVDENGVVTAVAPGNVIIFAVSNDGDFKSTCEVTVK